MKTKVHGDTKQRHSRQRSSDRNEHKQETSNTKRKESDKRQAAFEDEDTNKRQRLSRAHEHQAEQSISTTHHPKRYVDKPAGMSNRAAKKLLYAPPTSRPEDVLVKQWEERLKQPTIINSTEKDLVWAEMQKVERLLKDLENGRFPTYDKHSNLKNYIDEDEIEEMTEKQTHIMRRIVGKKQTQLALMKKAHIAGLNEEEKSEIEY